MVISVDFYALFKVQDIGQNSFLHDLSCDALFSHGSGKIHHVEKHHLAKSVAYQSKGMICCTSTDWLAGLLV